MSDVQGFPPQSSKTLLIDFDGTLFKWDELFAYPDPVPGAVEAMKKLYAAGWKLFIYSSRTSVTWADSGGQSIYQHRVYIETLLKRHGIPYTGFAYDKMPAFAYIDDRAIEFTGDNWEKIVERLGA